MRGEYRDRVREKGHRRSFHSLRGEEEEYVRKLMQWVNDGRAAQGLSPIKGHTPTWHEEKKLSLERRQLFLQGIPQADDVPGSHRTLKSLREVRLHHNAR
jgi:hypothetical protein